MGCWLFWGQKHLIFTGIWVRVFLQNLFFGFQGPTWRSLSFKFVHFSPSTVTYSFLIRKKHPLICAMQSHVSKGIWLRFGPSVAGKAGPHWIQLPPKDPVSPFMLVGGQNVTQAADKGCHYGGSRLRVNQWLDTWCWPRHRLGPLSWTCVCCEQYSCCTHWLQFF